MRMRKSVYVDPQIQNYIIIYFFIIKLFIPLQFSKHHHIIFWILRLHNLSDGQETSLDAVQMSFATAYK